MQMVLLVMILVEIVYFFGHDNDFIYNFILGGVLNGDMKVLRLRFRPTNQESHFDFMNFMAGNCFKNYEVALTNKYRF